MFVHKFQCGSRQTVRLDHHRCSGHQLGDTGIQGNVFSKERRKSPSVKTPKMLPLITTNHY